MQKVKYRAGEIMLEIKDEKFYLNGEKFNIYSGAIHYFRVLPGQWEDRLLKLKLAGFNTVETYVSWNLHEPRQGEFDFSGMLDIKEFIKTAQKLGLYAIVRPGPYICAEWDFGGFPAWLLADENTKVRCMDKKYLSFVDNYYKRLMQEIGELQITKGGNIIAMQIENEYGSYANDKQYLEYIEGLMIGEGVEVLMFTSDGNWKNMISGGSLANVYKVLNFGSGASGAFKALAPFGQKAPNMCGEFWCGWFDHWGERHHIRMHKNIVNELKNFLAMDASFNFYMFFGGTNFNFWAGANYARKYKPTTTSYDYSALLSESGGYTKAYHGVREVLLAHQKLEKAELPKETPTQVIGKVVLSNGALLEDNIDKIGKKTRNGQPLRMEKLGQNFGMVKYSTTIKGHYDTAFLTIEDIHDFAYIYINGEYKGKFDRTKAGKKLFKTIPNKIKFLIGGIKGELKVDILVDTMGRVNYGTEIYDRKGIGRVMYGNQIICDWEMTSLPLDDLENITFNTGIVAGYPKFMRGKFSAKLGADCYVDMTGFSKGCVYVNGFNLGRYWKKGPQVTLYLPAELLKAENEIVVLETEECKGNSLSIIGEPKFTKKIWC